MLLPGLISDPGKVFQDNYEETMAKIVLSNRHVTNISNFNDRKFQKRIIQELRSVDIAIIGSSRTMLIGEELFDDESKVFNSSVTGASIEDLIGLYNLYKKNSLKPKKVILGIDPWTFNEFNQRNRWKSISSEYFEFVGKDSKEQYFYNLAKFYQVVSPSYFQASVKWLMKSELMPKPTTIRYNKTRTKLTDGSMTYGEQFRKASESDISAEIEKYIDRGFYGISSYTEFSDRILSDLEMLVQDMLSNGIDIEFILTPYHPDVYVAANEYSGMIVNSEAWIIQFAKRKGICVYGSFNPFQLGFSRTDFYDSMHCNEEGIAKIFSNHCRQSN